MNETQKTQLSTYEQEAFKSQTIIENYLKTEYEPHSRSHPEKVEHAIEQWAGVNAGIFFEPLTLPSIRTTLSRVNTRQTPSQLQESTIKAMTTKEAAGEIFYSLATTHFGQVVLASTQQGVCLLHFCEAKETVTNNDALNIALQTFPNANIRHLHDDHQKAALKALNRIFGLAGQNAHKKEPITLHLFGTNFQYRVWQQLLTLPYGGLVTYSDIAQAINHPKAVRAVASAIGKNPIAGLIPCHRIVQKTGMMGGYRWGIEKKLCLIGWESTQCRSS